MQLSSLLGHTAEVLEIVHNSRKPADSLIDTLFRSRRYLGSHDRKFIAETTYGVLRHRLRCEVLLEEAGLGLAKMEPKDRFLWFTLTYLLSIEKRNDLDAFVQDLSEKAGSEGNASLAERLRQGAIQQAPNAIGRISREYSFQEWMVKRIVDEYGERTAEAICSALNRQAPLTIRANTLKGTVEECQSALKDQGIETTRTSLSPTGFTLVKRTNLFRLPAFRDGLFEVQDEGSQMVPILIDPKPTDRVLDACAGAGGKTLQLAALMRNRGEVVAADINEFRLRELKKRSRRAGAFNIRTKTTDELQNSAETLQGSFDVVFIDAPCSGLGTIRRNPGMKWSLSEADIAELSEKQTAIMKANAFFVKPKGLLVYATCTMFCEENEDVVNRFLAETPGFKLADPGRHVRKTGLTNCVRNGHFVLSPEIHGTDGFFCAVLERVE